MGSNSFLGQWQQVRGYAQPLWKIHRRRAGNPVKGKHKRRLNVLLIKVRRLLALPLGRWLHHSRPSAHDLCTYRFCDLLPTQDFVDIPGHPKLGVAGSVVAVAPGYGRNFLIPQGYARYAIPANLATHADLIESARLRGEEQKQAVDETAAAVGRALSILDRVRVNFRRPADPESETKDATTPENAVHVEHIVANAQRQLQVRIDPALIELGEPLVKFGEYDVPLRVRVRGGEEGAEAEGEGDGEEAKPRTLVIKVAVKQGRRIV